MKVYQNVSNAIWGLCKDVISRNYPYALVVEIPPDKDVDQVMQKLRSAYVKYDSPTQRSRARRRGEAVFRVVAVPSERIAWIAATHGEHSTFFKNPNLRDIRRSWVRIGGYQIKRAGKTRIAVVDDVYWAAWAALKPDVLRLGAGELEQRVCALRWFKSGDTLRQKRMLVRYMNRQRKIHHLSLLDKTKVS